MTLNIYIIYNLLKKNHQKYYRKIVYTFQVFHKIFRDFESWRFFTCVKNNFSQINLIKFKKTSKFYFKILENILHKCVTCNSTCLKFVEKNVIF